MKPSGDAGHGETARNAPPAADPEPAERHGPNGEDPQGAELDEDRGERAAAEEGQPLGDGPATGTVTGADGESGPAPVRIAEDADRYRVRRGSYASSAAASPVAGGGDASITPAPGQPAARQATDDAVSAPQEPQQPAEAGAAERGRRRPRLRGTDESGRLYGIVPGARRR